MTTERSDDLRTITEIIMKEYCREGIDAEKFRKFYDIMGKLVETCKTDESSILTKKETEGYLEALCQTVRNIQFLYGCTDLDNGKFTREDGLSDAQRKSLEMECLEKRKRNGEIIMSTTKTASGEVVTGPEIFLKQEFKIGAIEKETIDQNKTQGYKIKNSIPGGNLLLKFLELYTGELEKEALEKKKAELIGNKTEKKVSEKKEPERDEAGQGTAKDEARQGTASFWALKGQEAQKPVQRRRVSIWEK